MATSHYSDITLADVPALMAIENNCHSHPWSETTFKSCIGGRYFGKYLTIDNDIVGFYVGEHIVGEATLMDICVSPVHQGNGYGQQLLDQFLLQAQALENNTIWLEVRAKNISAQMLYIKHDFKEVSRRTGYYPSDNGGYEDAIVMCRKNEKDAKKSTLQKLNKKRKHQQKSTRYKK